MSVDLRTRYLGLELKNPIVAAASPLTESLDNQKRLEDAGVAAIVLPSLFEEQILAEEENLAKVHEFGTDSFAESLSYFPEPEEYRLGTDEYLDRIRNAKQSLSIPVIASLNGTSEGAWVRYAKLFEEAGADALELNIYSVAADLEQSAADVEGGYCHLIQAVASSVSIPVAVKMGPYFSSVGHFAQRAVASGAKGLVLFNRFLQPDIHLDTLETKPHLVLSTEFELLLPLRWVAILHGRINASLALTSGVHSSQAVLKSVLAGADVVMLASALYKQGLGCVTTFLNQIREWMEQQGYQSVEQMKGSMSHKNNPNPTVFERGNYMKAITSFAGTPI
ncbi:MAG: dihydroorotate dehydrogenase-like protein [Thermogutta sp.]